MTHDPHDPGFEPRLPCLETENKLKKSEEDMDKLRGQIVEPEDVTPPGENVVVTEMEGAEIEDQVEDGEGIEL